MNRALLLSWALLLPGCSDDGLQPDEVEALFGFDARRLPRADAKPEAVVLGSWLLEHSFASGSCVDCHGRAGSGSGASVHGGLAAPLLTDVGRLHRLGWRGTETDLKAFVRAEFARIGLADDAAVAEALAGDEALARRLAGRGATLTTFVDAVVGALIANRTSDAWERYVAGDRHALSANARAGLATFVDVGCAACHGGRTLGGVSNHVLGAAHPYPPGGIWRAPSLRHAARTAPYLHDDSVATLPEVARLMAYHELGTRLTEDQVAAIVTFLEEIGDVRS